MSQPKNHAIPGHYLFLALSTGIVPGEALRHIPLAMDRLGVTMDDLLRPNTKIPLQWLDELLRNIFPDSAVELAFEAGMKNRLTSQGIALSTLIMTSPTIRDALQLGRFMPLISTALSLHYEEADDAGYFFIHPQSGSNLLDDVIAIYMAAALDQLGKTLTGGQLAEKITMTCPMPERLLHDPRLARWSFNAAANCLVITPEYLETQSLLADRVAHQQALRDCESALAVSNDLLDMPEKIRRLLDTDINCRARDGVLDALHLSRSTLNRRLAEHGTTFAEILKDWRLQRAKQLLMVTRMSLAEISENLGYSDQSSFSHAFVEWTGSSPSAYRRRNKLLS